MKRDSALNEQHARDPQPGDYWDEMFAPVATVIDANAFGVRFLGRTKSVDASHWTWDTDTVVEKTRAEFEKWLRYGNVPGTWADVTPDWQHWREFAEEAKKHAAANAMAAVRAMSGAMP